MAFTRITAAEAAALIKNGDNIGLSGFTPAGTPKATTAEIAKIAHAEHEAGRPYQIGIFTGASTGMSCDGVLAEEKAIRYRAPYTTNAVFRSKVNAGEIAYNDIHLSQMAQELRYGFLGEVDWAILEVCAIDNDGKVYLTAAGGIAPTVARLAKKGIILELNSFHSPKSIGIHDVYEPKDPPMREPILISKVTDRIGTPYLQIDPNKVVGVVECNIPDEARAFKDPDPITTQIGQNVADFLLDNLRKGLIPKSFLNLQSGVGSGANAVLGALGQCPEVPNFNIYTEVLQDAPVELMREGRVLSASCCSLTVTNDCLRGIYNDIDSLLVDACWFGPGVGLDSFAALTIGAGVGYSLATHGRLVECADKSYGLVGHIPLDPNGPVCASGHRGCSQCLTNDSIADEYSQMIGRAVSFDDFERDAYDGVPQATKLVDRTCFRLGTLIAVISNIAMPAKIMIAGESAFIAQRGISALRDGIKMYRHNQASPVRFEILDHDWSLWAKAAAARAIVNHIG